MEGGASAASRLCLPATAGAVAVGAGEDLVLEDVGELEIESESEEAERSAGSGRSGADAAEEVKITGFGTLAQQRPARPAQERRARRSGGSGDDGAGDSAPPQDADARAPAAGLGARAAAMRASGSHLSQRMPRQPTASSDGRRHRRKKNKGGSWTRSALESRASGTGANETALPASASASLDLSRMKHETAPASRLSDVEGRDSSDEGGRQEAGVFEGMLGGVPQAHAQRLPFGATATAHRRRGGQRAGAVRLRTPRERAAQATRVGGSDMSAVDHTDAARWSASPQDRCDPPAAGFAVLSDSQLRVLRAMFDAVDCGRKGWLGRDDVCELVSTLDDATELHRHAVRDSSPKSSIQSRATAESDGSTKPATLTKQDSARGASSPMQAAPVSEAVSTAVVSMRATGSTAMDLVQAAAEEAEKKRRRDIRRLRKKEERVEKTVEELLKVLATVPVQSPQVVSALGSSQAASMVAVSLGKAGPAAKGAAGGKEAVVASKMCLSFDGFCSAVDSALRRTQAKCSSGDPHSKGGLSPRHSAGDLYCRKLVAHWPAAAAPTTALWGAEPEPDASVQAESESGCIRLLPSTAATELAESESGVRLLPPKADAVDTTRTMARGVKVPI